MKRGLQTIKASDIPDLSAGQAALKRTAVTLWLDENGAWRCSTLTLEGDRVVEEETSRPMVRSVAEADYRARSGRLFAATERWPMPYQQGGKR